MVIDLSKKSDRRAVFEQFAINAVRAAHKRIDPDEDVPLDGDSRERALAVLDLALNSGDVWAVGRDLLLVMAPKLERSEYRRDWIQFLERGIYQSQEMNDQSATGELSFYLGMLYVLLRNWKDAGYWLQLSASCFETLEGNYKKARTLNRLARVSQLQRDYKQARNYIKQVFNLLGRDSIEQEYSYFVLGRIAFDQENFEEAENNFRKSLEISNVTNNKYRIGQRFLDIGTALSEQKRFEEAINYYQQALTALNVVDAAIEQSVIQMNLGTIYSALGNIEIALDYYMKAKPILYEVQDSLNLARLYNNQAFDYYQLNRLSEAEHACSASIEHYKQLDLIPLVVNGMVGLGRIYRLQLRSSDLSETVSNAYILLSQIPNDPMYDSLYKDLSELLE